MESLPRTVIPGYFIMSKPNKITAIITAAGSGSRFVSSKTPKQYVNMLGKPLILYSMLALQRCTVINEIIISLKNKYFDFIHALASKNKITKLSGLVEGGKTRFQSVKNAFNHVTAGKDDLVLIHDAARPNISTVFIEKLAKEAHKYGCVIPGVKISETVKRDSKGYVKDTLNRENLWLVQTPQIFRYKVLEAAYKKCGRKNDFTDESSMVEYAGYKVRIIEGSRANIKITTDKDIGFIKKLMK
jgi:2-C-methyl-D-erythritol 4-phosphate cytidylyltransferase